MDLRLTASTEQFLERLSENTRSMHTAQQQISSGKRVTSVSDDPDQVSAILQTRLELEGIEQSQRNIARFSTEVDTAEQSLAAATRLMDETRVLAVRGASTIISAEERSQLAANVQSVLERMVALANTAVEGRFIFAGDQDGTAPYALDFNAVAPIPVYGGYLGAPASRQALAADGSAFLIGHTARQIFENADATKDVFAAIESLRAALTSGNEAALDAAVTSVQAAGEHIRAEHAFYGSVQARLKDAASSAASRELRYRTQLGALEDADMTQAIVEFTQAKTNREAALQAHAQIPRKTLFDYLG
jgi:flagellar hook-associated protein 3 FlgL